MLCGLAGACWAQGGEAMTPRTAALLEAGDEPVKVVCFGDSITGVYYHTGGVRAYPDMLGIALRRTYPDAKLTMVNAGISGHTTVLGLQRIERDVLAEGPDLVTVMFGMNDVVGVPIETYRENLREIVDQCRAVGAEVLLCTPNSVYDEDQGRPMEKLAQYAQVVRDVAAEKQVPLADCWQAYEDIRAADLRAWRLLLSETIHPNMNGHKVFAEEIARVISGQRVSLADVGPPPGSLSHTLGLLAAGKPVRVVVMSPYDRIIEAALKQAHADAQVQVTTWPVEGRTLAEIEAHARGNVGWLHFNAHPDDPRPDLVVVAVPAGAQAETEEAYIRSYSWVLNWSLHFGPKAWDLVVVLPEVTKPDLAEGEQARAELARAIAEGQDVGFIERAEGDGRTVEGIVQAWVAGQM